MNAVEQFTQVYLQNGWNNAQSRRGAGAALEYTRGLCTLLPALLRSLDCKSLLDAPCGDFHWTGTVDLEGIEYHGADVVPELVSDLKSRYPDSRFSRIDIISEPLPKVDFRLCRDVLFHLT